MIKKLALLLLIITYSLFHLNDDAQDSLVQDLVEKINSYQALQTTNASSPFKWYQKQGLFNSEIRLNFYGNPFYQYLRNHFINVADNNMFATGWILTVLLEANFYGKNVPLIDTYRLSLGLNAMNDFKNKNDVNLKHTLMRTFWQHKLNKTSNIWYQNPQNLHTVGVFLESIFNRIPYKQIKYVLNVLGLTTLDEIFEIVYTKSGHEIEFMFDMFVIPPDFDDTYLNLGLGAMLTKLPKDLFHLKSEWLQNNSDTRHLVDATLKYAYEPFSENFNKNFIDPRTYFFIRDFLNEAKKENKTLKLITTWIQNVDEQKSLRNNKISMPYNVNNIDVTVAANFVYGVTSACIHNINNYGDFLINTTELQTIYLNTTKLVSWSIKSNFSSRPDLALLYYPSVYNFFWYSSRTLFLIETELRNGQVNHRLKPLINEVKSYLKESLEINVSKYFLESYKTDSVGTYFCDFLGRSDTDMFGKYKEYSDDCLFSTSQAINSLIAIWTYQDGKTKQLIFKKSAPEKIKLLLKSSVNWLKENIFNEKHKKMNAFFSGCVKGKYEYPFFYPSNYFKFFSESNVEFDKAFELPYFDNAIMGVKGLIDENTYLAMLKKKYFGANTRIDFNGLNSDMAFIFWSSEPYTYAVALLAISQYNNLKT